MRGQFLIQYSFQNMSVSTYTFQGTSTKDKVSSDDLYKANPLYESFKINGKKGNDNLTLAIVGRSGADWANGGGGDDFMSGFAVNSEFAGMVFSGGKGTDSVYFPGATITDIQRVSPTTTEVTVVDNSGGSELIASISDTVEYFSAADGSKLYYLTEDIAGGRIRQVGWDEVYDRTYGDNADWFLRGLDTYTDYFDSREPQPEDPESNPNEDVIANKINGTDKKDRLTGSKGADEITGYGGQDIINARGGDDIIDAGVHTKGGFDKVKGGAGSDTFVIKNGYWTSIKDFDVIEDSLDLSGLNSGWDWEMRRKKTFIFGDDGYEVARLQGQVDLSTADIV